MANTGRGDPAPKGPPFIYYLFVGKPRNPGTFFRPPSYQGR
jgi:hypothetical protein